MNFARNIPHLRSVKFAPFAVISLFLFTNLTGVFFSHALAPVVNANPIVAVEMIPLDIPTSGNPDLDWIIFRTGERQGVDPRFIHAVIWQESKYDTSAFWCGCSGTHAANACDGTTVRLQKRKRPNRKCRSRNEVSQLVVEEV